MIHIISGPPGAGKSSLNTYFIKKTYAEQGRTLLESCSAKIAELNKTRVHTLTVPDKPPIFSDYRARFLVDYETYYEPYYINGYYLGLANERMPTQYLPPYSKVFLGEAQRYYNSRKSSNFPDHVSRLYEMHRHFGFDIYMDVQRVKLIDPNIRDLCRHFIEVQSMQHTKDERGRIKKTVWTCREFTNWTDFEDYLEHGSETYTETTYTNEGNIFDCFNSFGYFDMFVPAEGRDFNYLKHLARSEINQLPEDRARFYKSGEPIGYRTMPKEEKKAKQ